MNRLLQTSRQRHPAAAGMLALLLLLQLSVSAHDFQHNATELSEQCVTCVHFDQLGAAIAAEMPSPVLAPSTNVVDAQTGISAAFDSRRRPQTRAPPKA